MSLLIFFFQAEDGIRDGTVTGVQTCALSLNRHPIGYVRYSGTLAQVPIAGGAPRPILDDVEDADWSPDGRLAIVRTVAGRCRIEFPIGHVLYDTVGWISSPRFNPKGDTIAFVDHPFVNDDRGTVAIVTTANGKRQTITTEAQSVQGLAWRLKGDEIWFAAERESTARALRAVNLRGRSEEHTSELQSQFHLVCRLLLEKK